MLDLLLSIITDDLSRLQIYLFVYSAQTPVTYGPYQIYLEQRDIDAFKTIGVQQYGQMLSERIFDPASGFYQKFMELLNDNNSSGEPVRVRLGLKVSQNHLAYLNRVCWELITDPTDQRPLLTRRDILFSRSMEKAPVEINWLPNHQPRILAAAASPEPGRWPVDRLDVDNELDLVKQVARNKTIQLDTIPNGKLGRCTLKNLQSSLRKIKSGYTYDIFYLSCHGVFNGSDYGLLLEKEDGTDDMVRSDRLLNLFRGIPGKLPRLVILTACNSAAQDSETDQAILTLGPQLAGAGVQAVVAMQGRISQRTAQSFMSTLFDCLFDGADVDRAVSEARKAVELQKCSDWWMPVLYMASPVGVLQNGTQTFSQRSDRWTSYLDWVSADIRALNRTAGSAGSNPPPRPGGSGGPSPAGPGPSSKPGSTPSSMPKTSRTPKPDPSNPPSPEPGKPPKPGDTQPVKPSRGPLPKPSQPGSAGRSPAVPEKLPGSMEQEADVLYKQGEALRNADKFLEAIQCFEQVLAIKKRSGDRKGELSTRLEIALTYTYWGNQLLQDGKAQPALDQLQKAADAASPINDLKLKGSILHAIGRTYLSLQDVKSAIGALEQARVIRKTDGDKEALAATCDVLWQVYEQVDNLRMAAERLTTLIAYERTVKSPMLAAHLTMLEQINKRIRAG